MGDTVNGGGVSSASECRDPQQCSRGQRVSGRVLTTGDIISAVRRVGVPAASVEAPRYTLVNLKTTFFTKPPSINRNLTIIGYNVDVEIRPASYEWDWGDGSSTTTSTPGKPYPSTDVTHTYVHATDKDEALELSVDITYEARYRVDGGPWQTIPDVLTIPGASTSMPVKQASAVLVADD